MKRRYMRFTSDQWNEVAYTLNIACQYASKETALERCTALNEVFGANLWEIKEVHDEPGKYFCGCGEDYLEKLGYRY